ncbi:MAG: hypothetical protein IPL99_12270 [Candidatus Competibacteraceae bacterium]|nr:hypothetical protein [Candidatus Competibacteraceae bacterium]
MSNATDTLENAIGHALFMGDTLTVSQWTVHLFSVTPNEAGVGGTEITAGANGYQPVRHDPGSARWVKATTQDSSGNTVFRNNLPVQFPTAVSSWGTINYFGLKNQAGDLCFIAALTTPKTIAAGEAPIFLAGELEFLIG